MWKRSVICQVALVLTGSAFAATPPTLNPFSEGERLVYTKVVEAYRHNELATALRQRSILERNYPKSVHLDNAYYLTGVLQFQNNRFAEAVRDFGTVADRFPKSNKRPAALFAKGMTYDKLGLKPQATRQFQMIIKEYPGSQESKRAWMQLRVASLDSKNKRH